MSMLDPMTGLRTPTSLLSTLNETLAPYQATRGFGVPQPLASPLTQQLSGYGASTIPRGINGAGLASLPRAVTPTVIPNTLGRSISGLAGQVPQGAGAQALNAANALRGPAQVGGRAAGASGAGGGAGAGATGGFGGRAAMQAARSTLPGALGRAGIAGSLARGAPAAVSSIAAGALFGNEDESLGTQAARGFTSGAGWGAIAAPAVAAIPGVNLVGVPLVAAAAGITGTIGAALDVLDAGSWFGMGKGEDAIPAIDPDEILANVLDTAALPDEMSARIMDQYAIEMQMAQAIEDKDQRAQAEAAALQNAGLTALGALQQRDQASSAASNTLALQAQAADIFEPLATDIEQSGQLYAQQMAGLRDQLPESYRAISDATVARELSSSQKLANAYRAQAAITPAVNQLTQYQQDFNNYSAQLFSQALAQQAAGGGASLGPSAMDLQALLQPTG